MPVDGLVDGGSPGCLDGVRMGRGKGSEENEVEA